MENVNTILLSWYDHSARDLPWRVSPAARAKGQTPDPYSVWLSEIMLQQTTVAAVKAYFNRFMIRWPTVSDLACADDADVMAEWAGLGYYARARNLLKCAREVARMGAFPDTQDDLRKLPGIGPYTAAAVAAIAFDRPAPVMDGNVERVMSRLFAVTDPLPGCKPALYDHTARLTPQTRPGDYAQAVMDLGATICTPKNPSCMLCPLNTQCKARAMGIEATLPAKSPKPVKPQRYGHAFVARRTDGAILLETRPPKGLLGGMTGFPGSTWSETHPEPNPPLPAQWTQSDTTVTHVFTHFKLALTVHSATVGQDLCPTHGTFMDAAKFNSKSLPTVMRKVFDQACKTFNEPANA